MPKDLSGGLVANVLVNLEKQMSKYFEKKRKIGGSLVSGHIAYKYSPKREVKLTSDILYGCFADFYRSLECVVMLDEFPGDAQTNLPASIEGMFIVCGNNTIFIHIELSGSQLELNTWLRD
jgi:hypothetical protein